MKRFAFLYLAPGLLLLLWSVLPLVSGSETLYLRDVFNTHLPMKWSQAEAMRDGYLPLVDPARGGGQPHLGNPNTVPLYPDNLLYLVAPTLWAFNAHFWLHLLLAPLCFYWLGRALGLGRGGAWCAGVCWAASGFFLSTLNLYNVVAGVTLAPALAAAWVSLVRGRAPARSFAAASLLWTLLILGGDPVMAVLALVLAAAAVLARPLDTSGLSPGRGPLSLLVGSLGLGTLVAAPQVVEFLRILSLSFRGHWGYSPTAATAASWNPATIVEWFLPFAYGRPDLSFWGHEFYGGQPPLLYTFYPGVLALLFLAASGRPRDRRGVVLWALVVGGLFFALGGFNPIVGWLLTLPGGGLLRFPIKLWLLVAAGGALLSGLGFQRIVRSAEPVARRPLLLLMAAYAALWGWLSIAPGAAFSWLRGIMPQRLPDAMVEAERLRWAGLALFALLLLAAAAAALALGRRRPIEAGAVLLALHLTAQLFFLAPVMATDAVEPYLQPPPALASLPPSTPTVHGSNGGLFGSVSIPLSEYPDPRLLWLQRQTHEELYPTAGVRWGRSYDFNLSPEGLDSFLTRTTTQAIQKLGDVQRVRLLAAAGVQMLLLDRDPEPGAASSLVELARYPVTGGELRLFRILDSTPEVFFAGRVYRAPHLNATLARLTGSEFDPSREVVVPGTQPPLDGAGGTVRRLLSGPEAVEVEVDAHDAGALVVQRPFLPIYRAWVDGEEAPIAVANMDRMAVEVPAGRHRVRIATARRPLALAAFASGAGLLLLAALCLRLRRLQPSSRLL